MRRQTHAAHRPPAPGDVIVTKVGDRYHIGQMSAARKVLTQIAMRADLDDALDLARRFVTRRQRVFLYKYAGTPDCVEIDGVKPH